MTTESQITQWLATQQDVMVARQRDMMDIDSGSYNKPGIDAVGAVVQRFLAAHDIPVETLRQQRHGDCLRAATPWNGPAATPRKNRFDGHPDLQALSDRWYDPPPWEQMSMEERRKTFGYSYTPQESGPVHGTRPVGDAVTRL